MSRLLNNKIIKINIGLKKKITYNFLKKNPLSTNNRHICFICSPNNPTGLIWDIQIIEYLLKTYTNILFIIDETYIDFKYMYTNDTNITSINLINKYKNIIVMRSFSKAFGLAGLRFSYMLSNENNIINISKLISHKDIIEISKVAANSILENIEYYKNNIKLLFKDKDIFIKFLTNKSIKYIDTDTNFICIYIGDKIEYFINILLNNNIQVKKFNKEYDKKLRKYIRISFEKDIIYKLIEIFENNINYINTNKIERGFMDGCFDGLHYGHIHALYQAKQKCNTLIVATHEDSEIKKYKNKDPIYSYNDRYYMLKYCKFIDILKEESTEYNTTIDILDKNKCNKFFHGNDNIDKYPLLEILKKNRLIIYNYTLTISSTELKKRINNKCNDNINNNIKNNEYIKRIFNKIYKATIPKINTNNNIVILLCNWDNFNKKHIELLLKIKKKYNQYLIYIDLITDLYQYKIYSKYEIGITLLGITLIDNVLIHNSITNIDKLNIIQINTNLIEHSYIDKSFNNEIEKLYNLI